MKKGQLLGISVAGIAGLGAFVAMQGIVDRPVEQHTVEVQVNATEVLVAAAGIDLGTTVGEGNFRWQTWPKEAVGPAFITKSSMGSDGIASLTGSIARAPLLDGEPITSEKLVKPGQGGVLAAILPAGKRAISTKISEATAVGRLILPNDHVDVLLIRRLRGRTGEELSSETLFRNIRVLAIGQQIQNKEGDKSAPAAADTATLELTPQQSETLALANSMGEISLALRSIADIPGKDATPVAELGKKERSNSIKMLRYGNRSQANGVN